MLSLKKLVIVEDVVEDVVAGAGVAGVDDPNNPEKKPLVSIV